MKKIILLTAAFITLTACNNDDIANDDPVVARISATIGNNSRASESKWDNGDEIGVTMVGRYDNIKYTTDGNGTFDGASMYFKNKVEPVVIKAYYPFTGTEGQTAPIITTTTSDDRQTLESQPEFDFLYASLTNVTGTNPHIQLPFTHAMSKLTLTFNDGNAGTDVSKIVSYSIDGLVLEGTFNTATGVAAASGTTGGTLHFTPETVESGTPLPSIIIFPQTVARDAVTLSITDSEDQTYSCKLNFTGNALTAGNHYRYTINVAKTLLEIGNWGINPWDNVDLPEGSAGSSE